MNPWSVAKCVASCSSILLLAGCAGILSPGNYGGRSAVQQKLLAETVDESIERLGLGSRFSDKKVYVGIGDLDAEGVVDDYVLAAVQQELMRADATIVEDALEAEEQLVVRVRAAGADNSEPPKGLLSFLMAVLVYREVMTTEASIEAVSAALEYGTGRVEPGSVSTYSGEAENSYSESWYLFGIAGPFKSSTIAD